MKKYILFIFFLIHPIFLIAQSGNGHDPNAQLSYIPSGYTVQPYMRQAANQTNSPDNTISDGETCDLFVNFTYDTSNKNVYLVYTTDNSAPTKTNGTVVSCSFSNYSEPNRTWKGSIPASANVQNQINKYVFYISDNTLANAYGRVAADGYKTSWASEGDSFFEYTVEAPLPVQLTNFTAKLFDNNISLNWKTATEINNYGFNIECKVNNDEWKTIGFVQGNGNSNSPKDYSFVHSNVPFGKLFYRLKQIDFDGKFEYSNVIEVVNNFHSKFVLEQNFPNPFNPVTTINYQIPSNSFVTLKIFDILGNEIQTLVNEYQITGNYSVKFNSQNLKLSNGIYIYQLKAGNNSDLKKFVLLK